MLPKETKTISLEELGYGPFFEQALKKLGLENFLLARVIAEHKGAYRVKSQNGEYLAKVTGKQMFNASSREDYPAVGDWVAVKPLDQEQAVIGSVLPRKTVIKRKASGNNEVQIIAANVDVAFVIESVDRDYNLNRFERYFSLASGGIKFVLILNKIDLISQEELSLKLTEIQTRLSGSKVIPTSNLTGNGLEELIEYLEKGKTYCFLGSSGVGKSSLINKLLHENIAKTDSISPDSGRGKHVTTSREMYFLKNGSIVIDNPGMREVGLTEADAGANNAFDEITVLAKNCKYTDCTHTHEPGCEVLLALNSGLLDKSKYSNYIKLKKETQHYSLTQYEKKQKSRKFGKFMKKAKEEFKKYGHKANYG